MEKEKLKVGIIVNSLISPLWVKDIVNKIQTSNLMELKLVFVKSDLTVEKENPNIKTSWLFRKLLKYYLLIENKIVPVKNNSTKPADLNSLLKNIKVIYLQGQDDEKYLDEISDMNLDILLNIGQYKVPENLTALFNHGVIYNEVTFPDSENILPIEWFVINNHPCIELKSIISNNSLKQKKQVSQIFFAPDSFFINRVKSQFYWKVALITIRGLTEICQTDNEKDYGQERKDFTEQMLSPKNFSLNTFSIFKHTLLYVKKSIDKKMNIRQWIILYNKNASRLNEIENYKKIIPPKKNCWADPHIIKINGSCYIFIEEYSFVSNKGHISVFEINKKGEVSKPVKILEKPYHLSYPFIFEYKGNYYMIPESEQNGTVDIYKCSEFPFKWEFYKHIFVDVSAVDSTLIFHENKWWMFLNKKEGNYLSYKDELYLYYSDSPFSDSWNSHPKNPVVTDVRSARSAGRIYNNGGYLIRPAQDCSVEYGYKIRLNKIIKMTEDEYVETEHDIIEPNSDKNICGMHTLAKKDEYTVLDCKIRRSKLPDSLKLRFNSEYNL